MFYAGMDIGSTTVKLTVFNEKNELLFSKYERHFSDVKTATLKILDEAATLFGLDANLKLTITGSGGIGLSSALDIPFVQEVIACTRTIEEILPECDVAIELGGEDAKITFFDGCLEQRMNGSCAGGTGAFIDQMASLLKTDATGLNEYAKGVQTIYPIASRCGVFAKTDIQPLINEGARKEDIAASIFQAVVNQTIAGLASGRKIKGKVAFLGGPLTFLSELRNRFIETLQIAEDDVLFPENSQLFVAHGAALFSTDAEGKTIASLIHNLKKNESEALQINTFLQPLFETEDDY
ncbi:MAG: 2-hydroxyglutaryl-CoA dehydratase, partial [Streptococcaceae bacterium]|nr:2-hydroxyglutaryl-CoA dehydratase [Streptococcaceae bacterium]